MSQFIVTSPAPDQRPSPMRGFMRRLTTGARFVWDAAGIAILIFAAVHFARTVLPLVTQSPGAPGHPYSADAWFPGYERELATSLRMRWSSFVYWQRHSFAGTMIAVDSNGYRRTTQYNTAPPKREVWFFGGSTIWGTWQRDSLTIPSQVARILAGRGLHDVTVRNFGETGYVSSQELIRLILELRAGARPTVVAFGDGTADLAAAAGNGACNLPQNEDRRRIEFAIGRLLTQRTVRDAAELLRVVREHSGDSVANVPRFRAKRDEASVNLWPLSHAVVRCYAGTMGIIEALAKAYGFTPIYFWQPSPVTGHRALTPFEATVVDTMSMKELFPYIRVMSRLAMTDVDTALAPLAPGRFHNLTQVFNGDTATVFVDYVGHFTERSAGKLAEAMAGPIADALQPPARTGSR